jgi:hypothetical protein
MKTTVSVEVNMNSPHIGQSHSVDRSIHRCEFSRAIDMHTPHFYHNLSNNIPGVGSTAAWRSNSMCTVEVLWMKVHGGGLSVASSNPRTGNEG